MAEIFSGTSILRYELGLIGRASTNVQHSKGGFGSERALWSMAKSGPKYQTLNGMR